MLNVTNQLSSLPLFAEATYADLHSFVRSCMPKRFRKGELLISQGDNAEYAMFLVEGKLDVLLTSEKNQLHRLGQVHAGELFGEQGLFVTKGRRSAQVIANSDGMVLLLNRAFMHRETQNTAVIALERMMIAVLARRIRTANLNLQILQKKQQESEIVPSISKYTSLFQHLQSWIGKAS